MGTIIFALPTLLSPLFQFLLLETSKPSLVRTLKTPNASKALVFTLDSYINHCAHKIMQQKTEVPLVHNNLVRLLTFVITNIILQHLKQFNICEAPDILRLSYGGLCFYLDVSVGFCLVTKAVNI